MSDTIAFKKPISHFLSGLAHGLISGVGQVSRFVAFGSVENTEALDHIVAKKLNDSHKSFGVLCYADSFSGHSVLFVDPRGLQSGLHHCLSDNCLDARVVKSLARASLMIGMAVRQVGLVIIDLDSCGGVASVISDLVAFRLKHVDTPVILVSAESEVDDFSTERLPIADVTLRGPVSLSRLDLALAEAQINNQVWQSRNLAPLH